MKRDTGRNVQPMKHLDSVAISQVTLPTTSTNHNKLSLSTSTYF